MATARPYEHIGIFIPTELQLAAPQRIENEWPLQQTPGLGHLADLGFLLVSPMDERQSTMLLQSEQNKQLYINKILHPDPGTQFAQPNELRVSQWEGVLPDDATFFTQLRFFQKFRPDRNFGHDPTFSLYFDHCNGGTLSDLVDKYSAENLPVPEHFIWLVSESLCLAVAWLYFGRRPDLSSEPPPDNWRRIYHRNLFAHNVFIKYPRSTVVSRAQNNAFPEIVLDNFSSAGMDWDDHTKLPKNVIQDRSRETQYELREWEDVYGVGKILRALCQTHIPAKVQHHGYAGSFPGSSSDDGTPDAAAPRGPQSSNPRADTDHRRPDNYTVAEANALLPKAQRYSDKLMRLLRSFEYPGMCGGDPRGPGWGRGLFDTGDTAFRADAAWLVDTLFPAAADRVYVDMQIKGKTYEDLDVSWTRPDIPLPFAYDPSSEGIELSDIEHFELRRFHYGPPKMESPGHEPPQGQDIRHMAPVDS